MALVLRRRHGWLAGARLLAFALAALAGIMAWVWGGWFWLAPVGLLLVFLWLVACHEPVRRDLWRAERLVRLYDRGLERVGERWHETGPHGGEWMPEDHPCAADLDLLGPRSLFQRLAWHSSILGQETLARWLLAPEEAAEIGPRQVAAREFAQDIGVWEACAQCGDGLTHIRAAEKLRTWSMEPRVFARPWPARLANAVVAVNLLLLIGWSADVTGLSLLGWGLLIQVMLAWHWRAQRAQVLGVVSAQAAALAEVQARLGWLENSAWRSPRLADLRSRVAGSSAALARLNRLVDRLEWMQNAVFAPVGLLLMWTTRYALAVDTWRVEHGTALQDWLQALGEVEALLDLGAFAFEHPQACWPTQAEGPARIEAAALVHPLLPRDAAVANDVRLGAACRLLLVSGSNMSGKSTLLRTLGVNLVLAQMGAPVLATSFVWTPVTLGATLRIQDSLLQGRSRFYAEILRLRQIVAAASGPRPVLFLLDELLHGTNSHDRRLGAAGLLKGLLERGALGLATTHDLALTELASELGPGVVNVHFRDELRGHELHFDYRLRPGVVDHSNALALMRSVGLEV